MAELESRTALGTLHVLGADMDIVRRAAELATRALECKAFASEWIDVDGTRAYFKKSRLHGRARARWALKRHLLLRPLPRVREYHNLRWLLDRLFQAPEPLAAGFFSRRGLPCFQFLLTAEVEDATTLEAFLSNSRIAANADEIAARAAVLDELAREVARMHALGFVHHDLYPRNILVGPLEEMSRVTFLDCWAGGPSPHLRGPAYDLACLMLRASETWEEREQRAFFDVYCAERAAHDRPVDAQALIDATRLARKRLAQRLARRPAEQRGQGAPRLDWWESRA